jgi:Zn-dependent protease with chaperone function
MLVTLGACISFALLARMVCNRILTTNNGSCAALFQHWQRARQFLEFSWVVGLPGTLLMSGWGPWISLMESRGVPQSALLVLWFLPSLLALLLLEITASQVDVYIESNSSRADDKTPLEKWKRKRLSSRHFSEVLATRIRLGAIANVIACLLPVMLIALVVDGLRGIGNLMPHVATSSAYATSAIPSWLQSIVACFVGLLAVGVLLPQLLCRWMGVGKLDRNQLRERIETYARSVGVRVEPMWVASQNRWAGAAVIGWMPGRQQLWLGDGLVKQLSDEEIDMVVLHELAHVKRRHFLLRVLPIAFACLAGFGTWWSTAGLLNTQLDSPVAQVISQASGFIVSALLLMMGLSITSRSCELDADRQACLLGASRCEWAGGNVKTAARSLSQALEKLHGESHAATWLHPALHQRLKNLRSL